MRISFNVHTTVNRYKLIMYKTSNLTLKINHYYIHLLYTLTTNKYNIHPLPTRTILLLPTRIINTSRYHKYESVIILRTTTIHPLPPSTIYPLTTRTYSHTLQTCILHITYIYSYYRHVLKISDLNNHQTVTFMKSTEHFRDVPQTP